MSDKALAVRGVVFNWLGRGCAIIITFFLTPYLVSKLGDESYGLWSMVMAFTSYYAMADMGLRGAGVKYIAQYHAVQDYESVNKVYVTSMVVYSAVAAVVLVLVGVATYAFPYVVDIGDHPVSNMRWVIFLTGATMATRMLAQVYGAALTALQRHDVSNAIAVSMQLLQAAAVVAALLLGYGLVGMAVATFAVTLLGQLLRACFSNAFLPDLNFSLRYFDRDTLKMVFRFGGVNVIANTGRRLTNNAGALIVGLFLGPAAVPYYSIPESITQKTTQIGSAITTVLDPLASRLNAKGQQSALFELLTLCPRLLLTASLAILAVFVAFGQSFIGMWIRVDFVERAYPILCILAAARVAQSSGMALWPMLRGTNKMNILARITAIEIAATLLLGSLMAWGFGLVGMAFSVLITQIGVTALLLPHATCTALGFPTARYMKGVWVPGTIAAIPSFMISFALNTYLPASSMLVLLLQIGAVLACTGVSAFYICLNQDRRHDMLSAFMSLTGKRSVAS